MSIRISNLEPGSLLRRYAERIDTGRKGVITAKDIAAARARLDPAANKWVEESLHEKLSKLVLDGVASPNRPVVGDLSGAIERLNDTQRTVLADVKTKAVQRSQSAMAQLIQKASALGFSEADVHTCLDYVKNSAPITINFNPDKALTLQTHSYGGAKSLGYEVSVDRATSRVIDALTVDGHYKNQFETGITSGSNSAYPGGSRDNWEKTIFEGEYHHHELIPSERPKYGGLNGDQAPQGPASSYGSCYFVMKQGTRERTTFTPNNSSGCSAQQVGTTDHFAHVLKDVESTRFTKLMNFANGRPVTGGSGWGYIEAQIHGPLEFDKDIAQVVCHTKFKGTEYEAKLRKFAEMNGAELMWTDGFKVTGDSEK